MELGRLPELRRPPVFSGDGGGGRGGGVCDISFVAWTRCISVRVSCIFYTDQMCWGGVRGGEEWEFPPVVTRGHSSLGGEDGGSEGDSSWLSGLLCS